MKTARNAGDDRKRRQQAAEVGAENAGGGGQPKHKRDQVITRVNDHRADIYNRERWHIAEVDPEKRSVVLQGIDQPRQVELGADYLARTNPYNDAPALEHAYAVTTYSAQGTTVDRAFVMADPSMDKQEFYVAASRSREETWLYATPEVQVHREEIAPESPYLREGIPHIAEAAERDRAQLAAHDIAQLEALPTEELVQRRSELSLPAAEEQRAEERRDGLQREIAEIAERQQLAITAARISPPSYVRTELGERPSDPAKSKAWDRGVSQIEHYRQEHGVKDSRRAFGREPKGGAERARRERAMRQLRQTQCALGRDKQAARNRSLGRSLGIGR